MIFYFGDSEVYGLQKAQSKGQFNVCTTIFTLYTPSKMIRNI